MKTVSDNVLLPAAELEVMSAIWLAYEETNRPVTTREVLDANPFLKRWNITTILTFVGRLYGRGFIRIEKQNPEVGRGNMYTPLVPFDEYKRIALADFIKNTMVGDRKELARLLIESMSSEELAAAQNFFLALPKN